jgi:hypothetical protein
VQVEDRLSRPRSRVHHDTVVAQPELRSDIGDEVEHALRLVGWKLRDVVEARDVPLGYDEQVGVGLRIDVADRDEALRLRNVVAVPEERAEEAVVRQRRSPPPKPPRREQA